MLSAASAMTNSADGFVAGAMSSNRLEIESSNLALQRSRNPQVRRFAQHMITDHRKAGRNLEATLRRSGMDARPMPMEPRHKQQLDELAAAPRGEFDSAYLDLQANAHQEAIALFSGYAERGSDQQLSAFARETLPTLKMHAQMLPGANETR